MLPKMWRSRWWRWIAAIAICTPLLAVGAVIWRASHAQHEAAAEVRAGSEIPFRATPLNRVVPGGVEPITADPGFRDVALFQQNVIASARAGLLVYDRKGALLRSYRVGLELPPAELGAMAADRELWIATHGEGALAFNGTAFRQICPEDPRLRDITAVLALGSGRVLFGTEHDGVLSFDGRRLTRFHARFKSTHVTALAGTDGDLWIGTLQEGALHQRGSEIEDLHSSLPDARVLSLVVDGRTAYIGTPLGVVEFQDGKRHRTLADGYFAKTLRLSGHKLQVGTEDEGTVEVSVDRDDGKRSEEAPRIADLHSGPAVLSDRNIASLAVSGGRLWVGYFDRGLDILDAGLEHATHFEDDALFCVNRIVTDTEHARTAVATANGLVFFDSGGKPRQVMGRKDGFLSDHVTDVVFRGDTMVVATPAGLSFVDRSGVRSLYVFHGLVNNHVYTVAADGNELLAGTLGGVSILDNDVVRANYTTSNSRLTHNWITALVRVGDGWFAGTYGAGVIRLDAHGEWHSMPDGGEGYVVNPNAMLATGERVYAGSLNRGLFVYDRVSGRWTSTTRGLPSRNVTALAASGGYLYIGTENGLVRVAEGGLR